MKKTILLRGDCQRSPRNQDDIIKIFDVPDDEAYIWTCLNGVAQMMGPFLRRCAVDLMPLTIPGPLDDGEWECIEAQHPPGQPWLRGYVKFGSSKSKIIILYDSDVLAIMLKGGYGHTWFKELGEEGHIYSARQGLDYIEHLLESVFYAAKTEDQLVRWSNEVVKMAASFLVKKELLEQLVMQLKEKL